MRRGFTLLELAIVLVLVGLMVVFGMQFLAGKSGGDCDASTQAQLKTIDGALQNFIATQARLPKPADPTLGSSATGYGYEATGAITDPLDAGYASDVPASLTNAGGVLIGALPHVTLGLENSYSSDCWGDKFTYAVSNALTSGNSSNGHPSSALGTIVLKSDAATLISSSISYVVLSHGQDKFGATPVRANNGAALNCNGSTEPKLDVENCNSDATFMNATRNSGTTGNYFDDMVVFSAKLQSTEPCPAQPLSWLTNCSGTSLPLLHGASGAISNSAPGYTGTVTATCNDGTLSQSAPTCVVGAPSCAGGWSDTYVFSHEGDMGACNAYTLTIGNCTSGTGGTTPSDQGNTSDCIDHITGAGACTVHGRICGCLADGVDHTSYGVDGSNPTLCCSGSDPDSNGLCGNQTPSCDSDASDGLTGGLLYCSGVVIAQGGGDLVCSGGLWGASYPFTCNGALCQSGSASTNITQETSGCSPPPDCTNGDTFPTVDCSESAQCVCN